MAVSALLLCVVCALLWVQSYQQQLAISWQTHFERWQHEGRRELSLGVAEGTLLLHGREQAATESNDPIRVSYNDVINARHHEGRGQYRQFKYGRFRSLPGSRETSVSVAGIEWHRWRVSPGLFKDHHYGWRLVVPLWLPCGLLAVCAAALWLPCGLLAVCAAALCHRWWRTRTADARCARCGYDLRATPQRCPECGSVPEPASRAAA